MQYWTTRHRTSKVLPSFVYMNLSSSHFVYIKYTNLYLSSWKFINVILNYQVRNRPSQLIPRGRVTFFQIAICLNLDHVLHIIQCIYILLLCIYILTIIIYFTYSLVYRRFATIMNQLPLTKMGDLTCLLRFTPWDVPSINGLSSRWTLRAGDR